MKRITKALLVLILSSFLEGCVSKGIFPESASKVNFSNPEGKTGWARYEKTLFFPSKKSDAVFDVAKAALNASRFSIVREDFANGVVIGEHGMTATDWNVMTAIYLKQEAGGVRVRIHVEGSKDIGFLGDDTSSDWIGGISTNMRARLDVP